MISYMIIALLAVVRGGLLGLERFFLRGLYLITFDAVQKKHPVIQNV